LGIRMSVDHEKLRQFCRKWNVTELAVFGSALRDDFRPDSDVDLLVTFPPEAGTARAAGSVAECPRCTKQNSGRTPSSAIKAPFRVAHGFT